MRIEVTMHCPRPLLRGSGFALAPQDEDARYRRIASNFRMRMRAREELARVHFSKMTPHPEVPAQRASKDEEWGK
jgi:hypothetical protein